MFGWCGGQQQPSSSEHPASRTAAAASNRQKQPPPYQPNMVNVRYLVISVLLIASLSNDTTDIY